MAPDESGSESENDLGNNTEYDEPTGAAIVDEGDYQESTPKPAPTSIPRPVKGTPQAKGKQVLPFARPDDISETSANGSEGDRKKSLNRWRKEKGLAPFPSNQDIKKLSFEERKLVNDQIAKAYQDIDADKGSGTKRTTSITPTQDLPNKKAKAIPSSKPHRHYVARLGCYCNEGTI